MDELAGGSSPVHKLHPLVKFLVTIIYIYCVVSFSKYDLTGLFIMLLYPVLMFTTAGIPISTCFWKLRLVLPLVLMVGIFNPIFEGRAGLISMITLMLKGVFSLMASFIMVATTPIDGLCAALRKIHIPSLLVTLLLLTYRYISVLVHEVAIMTDAYKLRAPKQKGIAPKAWGSFLGQLLLRSMDRASELYTSMQLRAFKGEFFYAAQRKVNGNDILYLVICVTCFAVARFLNITEMIGGLFV
ncbi:MAG: cobalt ECF transporter T component CbiQ [Clostridia bacterium]|nr:cobalt ECF transporter T component CbiQ [Clostridia bacterium]